MISEKVWLESIIPETIVIIKETIEAALKQSQEKLIPITRPQFDNLKGFVSLSNDSLDSAQLTIKTSNSTRKFSLKSSFNLIQLQLANSCLKAAQSICRNYQELNKIHLIKILNLIQKADDCLDQINMSRIFPSPESILPEWTEISEDVVIEFYISKHQLITSVCIIAFHQNEIPLALQSKLLQPFKGPMKIETWKGKQVEVIEEIVVESVCPRLVFLSNCINKIMFYAQDLLEKLDLVD